MLMRGQALHRVRTEVKLPLTGVLTVKCSAETLKYLSMM